MSSRGIAVPVGKLASVVERLASGKTVGRAYLGIITNPIPVPGDLAGSQDVGQDRALIVLSVEPGSAAKAAGVIFGDVLLSLDDNRVSGFHDLTRVLTEDRIGKTLKLKVLRGGKVEELSVTPGAAQDSE